MFAQNQDLIHSYFEEYVKELVDDFGYSPSLARTVAHEIMVMSGHTNTNSPEELMLPIPKCEHCGTIS